MADAVRAGHVIMLRYLCNVSAAQDIYAVEKYYIHEYGCLANDIGLNAQRQNGKHPKAIAVQTTQMEMMKATTDITEATQAGADGLESFRLLMTTHFPHLQPSIQNAKRYSFYTDDKVRIVRAKQETPASRVNVKLALTSRRKGSDPTFNWNGTTAQILEAVEGELHLYKQYFNK